MPALESADAILGWKADPFTLRGVEGKWHTPESARGPRGLLVMFICNHCPYVQKQLSRIVKDCEALKFEGIGAIAIMSNDASAYPEDSFEAMQALAVRERFFFPYVIDPTQEVARAYGAVCTPEFYGFNANLELQYRGRLDESWSGMIAEPERELLNAMKQIAATGKGPELQQPSIGCSIKWAESPRMTG
jgi:peroxiredoxin